MLASGGYRRVGFLKGLRGCYVGFIYGGHKRDCSFWHL